MTKIFFILILVLTFSGLARAEESSLDEALRSMLGQPGGLTSDQVAERAVASDHGLQAKSFAHGAAQAEVSRAAAGFIPKVSGTARYTRLSSIDQLIPSYNNGYVFRVDAVVPVSDYALKTYRKMRFARLSERAAAKDESAERLQVAAQARVSYYNWVRAQAQRFVAEQRLRQVQEQLSDAEARYGAGSVILADVLQTKSQLKSAELDFEKTQNQVIYTSEQLRIAMHDPSEAKYRIGESFEADLSKGLQVYWQISLPDLRAEALAKRLELQSFEERVRAQNETVWVERSELFPKLEAFANASDARPNDRYFPPIDAFRNSWYAGGQVTWTVSDIPGALAAGRSARLKQRQFEAERAALADAVHLEVTQAWVALEEAKLAIQTTAQGLTAAEEAYRVRRDAFRVNKSTTTELTESLTRLTVARLEAINALVDLRIADVRLRHAVGRDAS